MKQHSNSSRIKNLSNSQDLATKYGGYDAIHRIIYELYHDMGDHPEIAYHFVGVDLERLSKLQAQFVCRALGARVPYEGKPIGPIHVPLKISEYQFDGIINAFEKIFLKNGFAPLDVAQIRRTLRHFRPMVVTCEYTWLDRVMIPLYVIWDRLRFMFTAQERIPEASKRSLIPKD